MKKMILSEEFKRMQKLAGIQINEDTQEVILYASWILDTPEARKENMVTPPGISEDNIPSSFSGNTTPNGRNGANSVILCTNYPWTLVSEPNEIDLEDIKLLIVKFKKPLTDVFLDTDDFDLDSFEINKNPDLDYSKDISLSELVPYGLNTNGRWYGCYVNDISSDEIISKKVGYQSESMGSEGEWSSF